MESANRHGLNYIIPCYGIIDCATTALSPPERVIYNTTDSIKKMNMDRKMDNYANISIVAGHFSWDVWKNLPSYFNSVKPANTTVATTEHVDSSQFLQPPPCLVIGRHPIDRMISYYYDRIYKYSQVPLNNLTVDKLQFHINTFHALFPRLEKNVWVIVDDGMREGMCRAMSDQKIVTGTVLPIDYDFGTPELYYDKPFDIHEASQISVHNVNQCVVGLSERWHDTKIIIHEFFPWLDMNSREPDRQRNSNTIATARETRDTLKPELLQLLLENNKCDMVVYKAMLERFELEMQYIRADDRMMKSTLLLGLPDKQLLPSPSNPFIFLHTEKCAGTTLKE